MAETAKEFFDGLEARVDAERAAGMSNSYLFDIAGAGKWTVDATGGEVHVSEGGESADCTIAATSENFLKIVRGELNPTTAYMTGKIKVKGDMGAALKLQKLF